MSKSEIQKLIDALIKAGETTTTLGAKVGVSYQTIRRWRIGEQVPNLSEIEKFQRILQENKGKEKKG